MFNFLIKIRKLCFSLREALFNFVFIKNNKRNTILNNKNLGNKQITTQEETFSFLKKIAFYTITLFLPYSNLREALFFLSLNYERMFYSILICSSLRETFDNKSFSLVKHFSKTNFVFKNKLCY